MDKKTQLSPADIGRQVVVIASGKTGILKGYRRNRKTKDLEDLVISTGTGENLVTTLKAADVDFKNDPKTKAVSRVPKKRNADVSSDTAAPAKES